MKGTGQPPTNVKLENTISKLKWEFKSLSFAIICRIAYKSLMDFAIKVSIPRLRTSLLTSPMDPMPVVAAKWIFLVPSTYFLNIVLNANFISGIKITNLNLAFKVVPDVHY